jgi:hypothetical protein
MSQDEVYKKFGEVMLKIAADPDLPVKSESFEMNFTKKDGKWQADKEYDKELMKAFSVE